ncbi:hypothetical protein PARC_a0437 [Pseudoalteromonas arctica A 37-1-2]|uniref:Uncharacterized protein n=1 Tax=Pseudoalteromonas arctica A 37-1-2 TaxID=1117313 RepID=A0A290RY77_9GAMM|nr:hypothetical protein PARC_a0437 [Pseudoalteromonas arctica A 37-1-2]
MPIDKLKNENYYFYYFIVRFSAHKKPSNYAGFVSCFFIKAFNLTL